MLIEVYQPQGFNVGINNSPVAGQTVPHAHIHIIPRYKKSKKFMGKKFIDPDWPNIPTLNNHNLLNSNMFVRIKSIIRDEFSLPLKKVVQLAQLFSRNRKMFFLLHQKFFQLDPYLLMRL